RPQTWREATHANQTRLGRRGAPAPGAGLHAEMGRRGGAPGAGPAVYPRRKQARLRGLRQGPGIARVRRLPRLPALGLLPQSAAMIAGRRPGDPGDEDLGFEPTGRSEWDSVAAILARVPLFGPKLIRFMDQERYSID